MTQTILLLREVFLNLISPAGEVNVLKGINLDIPAGESVSIVGPSGSGKTSLLMVIAGLERPTRGEVIIDGRNVNDLDESDLARFRRTHIGIVFQSFHLIPTMNALENTALPLEFAGSPDARDMAGEALARVGLEHRMTHFPSQMSGGEQQRVAIARAFVARPALLLADEPTGNLDAETEKMVMDLLFELQEMHKTTFLLVTHARRLAGRCTRILTLKDGRIVSD